MHNIFKKKKRDSSNTNHASHHHHSSGGGSNHGHGSAGGSAKSASGTRSTNFSYQSLNSHLINGSAAAALSSNSPVLNIQQHHLSGSVAPPADANASNGSRNSSSLLFASLLPSTSSQKYNSKFHTSSVTRFSLAYCGR